MTDIAPLTGDTPTANRYDVADRPPWRLSDALLRWETILVPPARRS